MRRNNLIKRILFAAIITFAGTNLIKNCQDNYYKNKPGIVYYIHGEKAIERRFDTNEELQKYLNSEEGKKEQEYYKSLK